MLSYPGRRRGCVSLTPITNTLSAFFQLLPLYVLWGIMGAVGPRPLELAGRKIAGKILIYMRILELLFQGLRFHFSEAESRNLQFHKVSKLFC